MERAKKNTPSTHMLQTQNLSYLTFTSRRQLAGHERGRCQHRKHKRSSSQYSQGMSSEQTKLTGHARHSSGPPNKHSARHGKRTNKTHRARHSLGPDRPILNKAWQANLSITHRARHSLGPTRLDRAPAHVRHYHLSYLPYGTVMSTIRDCHNYTHLSRMARMRSTYDGMRRSASVMASPHMGSAGHAIDSLVSGSICLRACGRG